MIKGRQNKQNCLYTKWTTMLNFCSVLGIFPIFFQVVSSNKIISYKQFTTKKMKLLQLVIVRNHSNGIAFMTPTFDPP